MLIVAPDRRRPVPLKAVHWPALRRYPPSLSRSPLITYGLVALVGTGIFAIVDQSFGRAARPPKAVERAPVMAARPDPQPVRAEPANVPAPVAAPAIATPAVREAAHATRSELPLIAPVAPMAHATSATAAPDAAGSDGPATTGAFTVPRPAARSAEAEALPDTAARATPKTSAAPPANCPLPGLRAVLADVQARFGDVTVVATHQHKTPNHLAGSSREKLHHECKAIDFRPDRSRIEEIKAFLRSRPEIGGVESYRDGVIHMDLAATAVTSRGARWPAALAQTEASKTVPAAQ